MLELQALHQNNQGRKHHQTGAWGKNTRAHHNVSNGGTGLWSILGELHGHLSPLALAHHFAGRTPEFDGTQKWSLTTSEEPGKGDLDEVVVAPVPE